MVKKNNNHFDRIAVHKNDILYLSENQQKSSAVLKRETCFPEYYVVKINEFNEVVKTTLDEWIYFLKTDKIKAGFKAKGSELLTRRTFYC